MNSIQSTTDQLSTAGELNPEQLQEVEATTLKQWLDQEAVTLIDVREPSEFAREHIPGAVLMPLSQFDPAQISTHSSKTLVLYCRSGNRSGQAAQKLLAAGFEQVTHLRCGLGDWQEKGVPLKINTNAPISLMRQVQITAGALVITGTLLGAFVSPWFYC